MSKELRIIFDYFTILCYVSTLLNYLIKICELCGLFIVSTMVCFKARHGTQNIAISSQWILILSEKWQKVLCNVGSKYSQCWVCEAPAQKYQIKLKIRKSVHTQDHCYMILNQDVIALNVRYCCCFKFRIWTTCNIHEHFADIPKKLLSNTQWFENL